MKTQAEVLALKVRWLAEGAEWNIEDELGFEEHYDELLAFRKEKELEWSQKAIAREARLNSLLPAYPNFSMADDEGGGYDRPGLTKREYFAGQILASIAPEYSSKRAEQAAGVAIALADALLKKLAED